MSFNHRIDAPSDRVVPRFYVNPEMLKAVLLLPDDARITGCTYDHDKDRFTFYVLGDSVPCRDVVVPMYRQEEGVTYFDGWR